MRVKHLWITKLNTSHSHECDCDLRVHCVCMCKCTYSCERLARAAKLPVSGIVHTLFHCGVYTLPLWSVHSLLLLIVLPVYKYKYIHVPLMWTCIGHGSAVFICIHFFFLLVCRKPELWPAEMLLGYYFIVSPLQQPTNSCYMKLCPTVVSRDLGTCTWCCS